ncbi:hypothetical protein [Terriglobus sp. TAA 43]|uniref:hypothetical protein n=1 Tax=Terriglobus sp. TAA 43 TaxID=278961 RepID=UPI0006473060|nr:hypothetical protein [Terriglobus sp. TAA 43]
MKGHWWVGVALLAASAGALGQGQTKTSGACSPVVTGAQSIVTIRCAGMSEAKANQLIALMNKILAERLDLSDVNKKLDDLSAQMTDVGSALNPMAGAPIDVVKLYEEGQDLAQKVQSLQMEWNGRHTDATVASMQKGQQNAAESTAAIDAEESQKYRTTLETRLVTWRKRVQVYLPNYQSSVKYSDVTTTRRLMDVYVDMMQIGQAYQQKRQNEMLEKRAQ